MAKPDINSNISKDQHDLTSRIRDTVTQQIDEMERVQMDLREWYAMKLGKEVSQLNLDECPASIRVMQVIRLLRESQVEFEQALEGPPVNA